MHYDQWFSFEFASGIVVDGRIDEAEWFRQLTFNVSIVTAMGRELSIVIDVATSVSGCEAIVEGFYSVMRGYTIAMFPKPFYGSVTEFVGLAPVAVIG